MAKCFLTYEQQIDKLINEKGLLIADREYAENVLKRTSYYSLISGYKDLFKNPTTKAYRDGTRLEDIVALYDFDRMLRELFLSYILRVENHIKSLLSYAFCEKYGESQNAYLNKPNYN
ncbi:MAG: Abi family protein [Lachnospiraceae bacterium]|nr:Abi family protein [Lachnospiraceae bacterium]